MTDKRIIKTERDIKQAFLNLLKTTPFQKINVNQICNEALVSRSTFYEHFQDKYDLLSQLVKQYTKLYQELVEQRANQIIGQEEHVLSIPDIAGTLLKHRDALNTLLGVHEDGLDLLVKWEKCLSKTWHRLNHHYAADKQAPDDFVSSLESAIVLNYIRWSLKNGMNDDAAALSEHMIRSIYGNAMAHHSPTK
ncbi:TetR family transcriptional regulator [Secundilactobacillus pentosiphilus]|uniref:TetR family transcriptional regulator n=1 Tax=Secundilactobacillus pentosiphilus TaxID=1714682 RepID=A0A1Z5IXJ0_9LACO|nr:TetR/AcrR family transcriptional regulator [Secundilactobacillus pentosiphilus]GAX06530.1 TetR family transcriptional regulator [Secundilactobacillus pentosiphilus]